MTTRADRLMQELDEAATARPRDSASYAALLERAVQACVTDPAAEDVWVYNNAGLEYAGAGEHDTALEWLTDGLRLALRTADPERLVDQLADLRQVSLDKLGRAADALQKQASTFLRDREDGRSRPATRLEPETTAQSAGSIGTAALAWLPAGDYEQAVKLWPDLAGSDLVGGPDGPLPHWRYCRAMQEQLVEFAEAGAPGLSVAPIRVAPFTAWCTQKAYDPDSAQARAEFAARLAASADPDVVSWPPGRNQPCWCGSGRKYKKCCAATSLVFAEPK